MAGVVPALIFGVALGNVLQGVPFRLAPDMRIYYEGTFFGLLNPFALLAGLVSLCMLLMHGASWLVFKTEAMWPRARALGMVAAVATTVLFAAAGVWLAALSYRITSEVNTTGPSNPLFKTAALQAGAWLPTTRPGPCSGPCRPSAC